MGFRTTVNDSYIGAQARSLASSCSLLQVRRGVTRQSAPVRLVL